jgi:hypothetical protein
MQKISKPLPRVMNFQNISNNLSENPELLPNWEKHGV